MSDQMRAAKLGEQVSDLSPVGRPPDRPSRRALPVAAPVDEQHAELVGQRPLRAEGVHPPAPRAMDKHPGFAAAVFLDMKIRHIARLSIRCLLQTPTRGLFTEFPARRVIFS